MHTVYTLSHDSAAAARSVTVRASTTVTHPHIRVACARHQHTGFINKLPGLVINPFFPANNLRHLVVPAPTFGRYPASPSSTFSCSDQSRFLNHPAIAKNYKPHMAVDTERRAKKSASRLENSLLLQPINTTMSYNPSTHSPDHLADANSFQSPADHTHPKPILPGQDLSTHQLASKKRRSSKSKNVGELRRSTSTPHMRNAALGNSGDLSPTSNKPRNKLGYHRTSVACGHCRRRKIRCLLASEDPQGRCANCIRLKKECNFYPVEHNPDAPSSQALGSKDTSPVQPLTPAASSPRHPQSGEKVVDFRAPLHAVSSNTGYGFQTDSEMDPRQGPNSGRMPVQQPSFPYPHPIDTQWPPATTFLPSSTIGESPQSSTGYWRQSPSTATSTYGSESNVSGGRTPAAMSTSSTMSYGHPENHSWGQQPPFQPPTRSMSYGIIEGISQPYSGQGLGIQQHQDFPRRTSPYPYPSSIDTNTATTVGGSTSAPLSAPVAQNQFYPPGFNMYDGMQPQGGPMQMPGRSMSVQWYSEPSHLDRVQEEGVPPVAYSQHGMQHYYSGS
ncbi:hypothetical protein HBH98_112350 [Parastagonospora nodorum]|nr:hypothetical protein HBI06_235170 [Parastagonospora nodorum]KAH4226398.1 hypothetical protein HBI05_221350 [Parastagonospora nodorum]KAH4310974.1 hypothetical protein HBI02_099540 [Parastagonospora nodorum]KAH4346236.1 hypothetical protein HBH98_112350 [Parastagonospora nodorum]KAH4397122.1 hypothetical protein HBH99_119670 [Parastagonospora nodorum]